MGITLPDPGTDISGAGWTLPSAGSEDWDCSAATVNAGVMWGKPGCVIHDPPLGEAPEELVFDGPFSYGLLTSGAGVCRLHTSAQRGGSSTRQCVVRTSWRWECRGEGTLC